MRHTLHTGTSNPIHISEKHLEHIREAVSRGAKSVEFPILNDSTGAMRWAFIPVRAIEQILGPEQPPTAEVLRFYAGEPRFVEFTNGTKFCGTLRVLEYTHFALEWQNRLYYLPIETVKAARATREVTPEGVNSSSEAAKLQCFQCPELQEATQAAYKAGIGQHLLVVVSTFNEKSADVIALAMALDFDGASAVRVVNRPTLDWFNNETKREYGTAVTFSAADALAANESRVFLFLTADANIAAVEKTLKSSNREIRFVQMMGRPPVLR